jgi:RsiW-degrading membrane proteinase PrsW (M82 family)
MTLFVFVKVLVTGFLPALLWLWFWLKEDPHPEPRRTLVVSFVLGMAIVPVVLVLEYVWYFISIRTGFVLEGQTASLILLFGWAFLEEGGKFLTAWWADLKRSVYDEPVDAVIYLITVALGFSALENFMFLLNISGAGILDQAITGNLRFLGASLLHVVTSGIIGVSIAFTFFHKEHKWRNIWGGIILATVLHAAFNAVIINSGSPATLFQTFFVVWTLVIILIFVFEKVKRIGPNS